MVGGVVGLETIGVVGEGAIDGLGVETVVDRGSPQLAKANRKTGETM